MAYGYIGSMKTRRGKREEVISILLSGIDGLQRVGCLHYSVSVSLSDDVTIWTTEIWMSKKQHDASLQLPQVRDAIARTLPLLTGEFTREETTVRGGIDG